LAHSSVFFWSTQRCSRETRPETSSKPFQNIYQLCYGSGAGSNEYPVRHGCAIVNRMCANALDISIDVVCWT
jgi:hypothetical protein